MGFSDYEVLDFDEGIDLKRLSFDLDRVQFCAKRSDHQGPQELLDTRVAVASETQGSTTDFDGVVPNLHRENGLALVHSTISS